MYYLFIDFEATDKYSGGKNPKNIDGTWKFISGITEIAAILYDVENDKEIDRFHQLCKPMNRKMSEGATIATGYTDNYLAQFDPEDEVILEFITWVGMYNNDGLIEKIVGHNYEGYDDYLISNRCAQFGYVWPLTETPILDTYKHAKGVKSRGIPQRIADTGVKTPTGRVSYTQEAIAAFYGFEYDAHRAISDIETLIKIFKRMFGQENVKQRRKSFGF